MARRCRNRENPTGSRFSTTPSKPSMNYDLPDELIEEILALPRESAIADLLGLLVTKAYERDLVSEIVAGNLQSVLDDMAAPQDDEEVRPWPGILAIYHANREAEEEEEEDEEDDEPFELTNLGLSQPTLRLPTNPVPEVAAGRNDPCPCGSGRKYKKCSMV